MSAQPEVRLEHLAKRDAVVRLRAVYALLERGWQVRRRVAAQPLKKKSKQEEVS